MENVLEEVYTTIQIIESVLMDEFPELSKQRANEIANRIYDEERGI